MPRLGIALVLVLVLVAATSSVAFADEPTSDPTTTSEPTTPSEPPTASEPTTASEPSLASEPTTASEPAAVRGGGARAPQDLKDQGIGASLGIATGGRVTPGGLRVAGHYLYQLADADWFDGSASFTFGGGDAACFRDRMNDILCDHGLADGKGVEVSAAVRHFFPGKGTFWPFARAGIGLRIARFSDDEVTGLAFPLHAGAGLRVSLSPQVALTALAELELGFGRFNHSLGWEPQLGATISAGAEFGL